MTTFFRGEMSRFQIDRATTRVRHLVLGTVVGEDASLENEPTLLIAFQILSRGKTSKSTDAGRWTVNTTFVHLYSHPRISSLPLATEGVVDCMGCELVKCVKGGTMPVARLDELGAGCMTWADVEWNEEKLDEWSVKTEKCQENELPSLFVDVPGSEQLRSCVFLEVFDGDVRVPCARSSEWLRRDSAWTLSSESEKDERIERLAQCVCVLSSNASSDTNDRILPHSKNKTSDHLSKANTNLSLLVFLFVLTSLSCLTNSECESFNCASHTSTDSESSVGHLQR